MVFLILTLTEPCISNEDKSKKEKNNKLEKTMEEKKALIDREKALKIAKEDAQRIYRDLSIYKVEAALKEGKWYVDYELTNPQMVGGGPHYVISAETGEIITYRYEQ
jgi:hypothetical protein